LSIDANSLSINKKSIWKCVDNILKKLFRRCHKTKANKVVDWARCTQGNLFERFCGEVTCSTVGITWTMMKACALYQTFLPIWECSSMVRNFIYYKLLIRTGMIHDFNQVQRISYHLKLSPNHRANSEQVD